MKTCENIKILILKKYSNDNKETVSFLLTNRVKLYFVPSLINSFPSFSSK